MRIVNRILIWLVVLVVVGAGYQWYATSRDAAAFPMPGQLVDVGGRSLHVVCSAAKESNAGDTTVLLENGLSANYTAWLLVQPAIAQFAKVCSYDRAGMGFSDPSRNATQAKFVAEDLAALRKCAHIDGALVLVGWSAGGVFIRHYYHSYPDDVIGMVFVDSSHEQQRHKLPTRPDVEALQNQMSDQIRLCNTIAWNGLVRALGVFETLAQAQKTPEPIRPASIAMSNRTGYCAGVVHEMEGFVADVSQTSGPQALGDLPIVVLTRGKKSSPADFPVPIPADYLEAQDQVWLELQNELAALSTRSSHRFATLSGHGIPLEAPDMVVEAVRDVIDGRIGTDG